MCDSDVNKWDNVLLEWANCLKISAHINTLLDLQNGEFFNKLLIILLNRKVPIQDTIPNVYKFLNTTYPNIHYLNVHKHLDDLDKKELRAIASLLMHYACIYDRREDLTSPLCYKLSPDVQLCVKTFLENITPAITNSNFEKVIDECMSKDYSRLTPGSYQWQHCGDSPLSHKSPLQAFLRTPVMKSGRMQEKDREIKKLKSDLDMQKYEREDLFIELKEHKDKIKKISREVTEKTIEVAKLSSQLVALENRTPPHQPRALQEIERHLRAELHNAQKFISQLQEQIDELENSKEEIFKKQKKTEEETCLWQDRAVIVENKYDSLTTEHREQALELSSLRMNYNELKALLEELRGSSKNDDSCIEMDYSQGDTRSKSIDNISTSEEFACTVVEVQLREVQNQNHDLNIALNSAVDRSVDLESGLKQIKEEYNILMSNFESLEKNNQQLEAQVKELEQSQSNMESINQELLENVANLKKHNSSQTEELHIIQKSLNESKSILSEKDLHLSSLQMDYNKFQTNYDELRIINEERKTQYSVLEKESEILQSNLEDAVQKFTKKEFECESLAKLYAELDENIEINLKKLVSFTSSKETFNFQNKSKAFENILKELDIECKTNSEEKFNLSVKISNYEKLVVELETEILNLTNKEKINSQLHNQLNEHFNEAKLQVKELEITVGDCTTKIDSLNRTIIELNLVIDDLENLKIVIQQQSNTIQDYEQTNMTLRQEINENKKDINCRIIRENHIDNVVKELESVKSNLEKDLLRNSEEFEAVKLNMQEDLLNRCKVWETVKINLEKDLTRKSQELEIVKTNLEEELFKKDREFRNVTSNLEKELLNKNQELLNLHQKNEEKLIDIKNLEEINGTFKRKNEGHLEVIKSLERKNADVGSLFEERLIELKQLKETNKCLGNKNEERSNEINILTSRTNDLISKNQKHKEQIQKFEESNNFLGNEIEEHIIEKIHLNNMNSDLENKNEEQLAEIENLEEIVNDINSKLSDAQGTIKAHQVSHEELQKKYDIYNKSSLEEINILNNKILDSLAAIETLEISLAAAKEDSDVKTMQINNLNKQQKHAECQYEEKVKEYQQKINVLQDTVSNFKLQVTNINKDKAQLDKEITEQLDLQMELKKANIAYEKKCKDLEVNISKLVEQIAQKESVCVEQDDVLSKTNTELLQLKLLLEKKQQKIEDITAKSNNLVSENKLATSCIDTLTKNKESLESEAAILNEKIKIMREHKIELEKKLAELQANTLNFIKQLGNKNDELNAAVENLKIYKTETANEIEHLKSIIIEVTHKLEQANEERVTLTSNYQKEISEDNNKIMFLGNQLEVLKIKEIGYLQEIGMIKDELTDTINKYTDALQIKDDLRSDNESQISLLTENIHEIVEKYNNLDEKHNAIVVELHKTKLCLEEMEEIKHSYEMQLVQQKHKYEEDFMAAADQYKCELEGLASTQSKLLFDIEKYNLQLEDERTNRSLIGIKLEKAESDLRIVGEEKAELLLKIEKVIETNRQLETEYSTLQIENEDYLKESKITLSNTQCKLEEAVEELEELKTNSAVQIENLRQSVEDLKEEMITKQAIFTEELCNRNSVIEPLNNRVKELESHVITLESGKEQIRAQIVMTKESYDGLKNNYIDKQEEIIQLQSAISKLQCAYDILNTGRQNVDAEYAELSKTCEQMKISIKENELKHEKEINDLQSQIRDVEKSIEEKTYIIEENEMKMKLYNDEAETIKKIVETMKMDKEEIEFDRDSLRTRLSIIEEDHDNKIKEEIEAFNTIKERYDVLLFDKGILEQHNDRLKQKLDDYFNEKEQLEITMRDKEESISKLLKQLHDVNTFLEMKDSIIESLENDMGEKLVLLETISKDKVMLEQSIEITMRELESTKRSRDDILETHSKLLKDTENILLIAHKNAMEVKDDLLKRIETAQKETKIQESLKIEVELLLQEEKRGKEFFETQILELKNEQFRYVQVLKKLKDGIQKLDCLINEKPIEINDDESNYEILNEIIVDTEKRIVEIYAKKRELNDLISKLEVDKTETIAKISELEKFNESLSIEKSKLLENYETLHLEKVSVAQEKDKESKCLENLKTQYELLKNKYDEAIQHEDSLDHLKQKNNKNYQDYQDFIAHSKIVKKDIDQIISERNSLEAIVSNLKDNYLNLQIKATHITEEKHKLYYEQKHTLEIIFDDIQKQFSRLSKVVYNTSLNTSQIFEKTVTGILTEKPINWESLFKDLNIEETLIKLEDLKDNASNTLEQLKAYENSIDALNIKLKPKVLKENLGASQKPKDDDWKKKYTTIKQRLTLIENAKNNYEKKLKQLREEIKILTAANNKKILTEPVQSKYDIDNDIHYKTLLQQHVQAKEDHERLLGQYDTRYKNIMHEFEEYKLAQSNKGNAICTDKENEVRLELQNLRSAYGSVMSDNARLDMENATLRQLLEDRNKQLGGLQLIKEAYEKLFEENNKLMQNIDTLKYKRNRDREEYVRLLKKEKDDGDAAKKIQEVRTEYEMKLTKMKGKMIELYQEEVDRQVVEKSMAEKEENVFLTRTVDQLRQDLRTSNMKLQNAERERISASEELRSLNRAEREPDLYSSRESIVSRASNHGKSISSRDFSDSRLNRNSTQSLGRDGRRQYVEDARRFSTLPKSVTGMDVIEEVRICRRTSINSVPSDIGRNGIEMEDEGDLFNNKYLADLKEGRCSIVNGRESNVSRMSELVYRNSLCPPHLKSSYPAETQFSSPNNFKENDIKTGAIDFDDSMSTRLLPGEKRRKDAGTTSYKRPGPPTPSKHGGRSSLQGNEFHLREPLKENTDKKSPKKSTPNRLKALFTRSSAKDTSENQPVTPKGKRLSIFRKPR